MSEDESNNGKWVWKQGRVLARWQEFLLVNLWTLCDSHGMQDHGAFGWIHGLSSGPWKWEHLKHLKIIKLLGKKKPPILFALWDTLFLSLVSSLEHWWTKKRYGYSLRCLVTKNKVCTLKKNPCILKWPVSCVLIKSSNIKSSVALGLSRGCD